VHIDELPRFPDYLPGWSVPGMHADRVELLMRSLPKSQRTACFPIADAVDAFLDEWGAWQPDRDLLVAMAEFLSRRSGQVIEPGMFEPSRLPAELRPKLRVLGDEGKVYGIGEDVRAAKDQLAAVLRQRREDSANLEWEMTGGTFWSFGDLPLEQDGVFPALVDEGASVGTRAFLDEEEAEESHRAGVVRLFLLDQAGQVEFVRKRLPLGPGGRLYAGVWGKGGDLVDDLMRCAGEGAMMKVVGMPRNAAEFELASKEGKGRLFECAQELAEALERTVESFQNVWGWMDENRSDRHLGEVVADVEEQLEWLLRPGFAWKAGFGRMRRYERYFRGIEERLKRVESHPLVRDEEKQDQLAPLREEWIVAWQQSPEAVRLWEIGWMIEEWRLQLFAPGMPRVGKVSGKRIARALEGV
jgi:ATP-dependent helicase HrpA